MQTAATVNKVYPVFHYYQNACASQIFGVKNWVLTYRRITMLSGPELNQITPVQILKLLDHSVHFLAGPFDL